MAIAASPLESAFPASVDARRPFFIVLIFLLVFAQGIRLGGATGVPIPSALLFGILYLAIFNPRVLRGALPVYSIVFAYLLLTSARNALEPTGNIKDFLYVGLAITSFVLTVGMEDAIEGMSPRSIGGILFTFFVAEVGLQVAEYMNPFDLNRLLSPLLSYWNSIGNAEYLTQGLFSERTPGSFGSPTVAGFSCYLLIRSVAILLGRRWMIYLAIIPLVIGGARSASAIFLIWEALLPMLSPRYRRVGFYALLGLLAGAAAVVYFAPSVLRTFFLFQSFMQTPALNELLGSRSVVARLTGLDWALDRPVSQWVFGGMTATEIAARSVNAFSFDSEFLLRSMQYGVIGYGCMVVMNVWTGFDPKNWDWWFVLFVVLLGAVTNSIATSVIIFPFVILYSLCLRRASAYAL